MGVSGWLYAPTIPQGKDPRVRFVVVAKRKILSCGDLNTGQPTHSRVTVLTEQSSFSSYSSTMINSESWVERQTQTKQGVQE
jgi:hypothetical protein